MSSTWIQMPVENALEVVQRYISDAWSSFYQLEYGNYFKHDSVISYESDCEVWIFNEQINNIRPQDMYIYFGYFYLACDNSLEQQGILGLSSGVDSVYTVNTPAVSYNSCTIPIMFNACDASFAHNCYFIGYKFKVTNP